MEKMSKYQDYIQPFLDGELSRQELDLISKELESNAVLAEDIKLYREVDLAIKEQDVIALRSQLEGIHQSLDERVREPRYIPRYQRIISYAAIASLAILISVGILYKMSTRKLSNDKIYEKYYEPYEVTMVYRSAESDAQKMLNNAMVKYEAKDYQAALTLFEQVLEKDPGDMETELYSGISYMEIKQYRNADHSFSRIIEHNDNLYVEQAEWSLGFCYLMTGKNKEARELFARIASKEGFYRKQAAHLARRIN
jgi:tetratricopeptide (TPR) repeat protein